MHKDMDYSYVLGCVLEQLALACGVPEVHEQERLGNLALDSIEVAGLMAELGSRFNVELKPTLFWTYPTPAGLARHIAGHPDDAVAATEPGSASEPVAITGLACRFPGARDANAYWHLLINGQHAIGPLSPAHYREFPSSPWHVEAGEVAGFIDDLSGFDHGRFGIGAHEASCMDPQQRLLLELSWDALEQAGMDPRSLKGRRGGVYVGAMWSDFSHHVTPGDMTAQSATGTDGSILSARLSFVLGLTGPSLTVNTACSSSLVALHLACQSLRNNECDFAVVAGVNLLLAAQSFTAMRRFGGLSDTGVCRTFDAAADGYVRAEGCGVVILRPLSRVLIEAAPVWGVIRSSVINNNGYHGSLTAPSAVAQQQLLREACAQAALRPGDIHYVEAHGTGTAMGDPIEVSAISAAYCRGVERKRPLLIGSVKTNIGHCEAAAGMAGLIKALLAMHHGLIPAHLNYQTPNPAIDWEKLRLRLVLQPTPWDAADRVAGISSFGFGGTNAHIIVSETWPCLPVGGANPGVERAGGDNPLMRISAPAGKDSRALLVFPGQGAHWAGMGRYYARLHPVFRETINRCDCWVRQLAGWSLADRLYDCRETFSDVRIAWPCHVAIQLALAEVWLAKGLRPAGVIGHSIGEIAAAHVAGLITLHDAFRIILAHAEWANRHRGAMALAGLDWDAAQRLLDERRSNARCAIQHSGKTTIVTGSRQELRDLQLYCQRTGVSFSRVRTNVSVHKPVDGDSQCELAALLGYLAGSASCLPFYSGARGGARLDRLPEAYWEELISRPFRWFDALKLAVSENRGPIVQVAPHPVLSSSIQEVLTVLDTQRDVLVSGCRGYVDGIAMSSLLERYPRPPAAEDPWRGLHLLLLSGYSVDALSRRCQGIAQWLAGDYPPSLADCARALVRSSSHDRYRLTLIVDNRDEAIKALLDMSARAGAQADDLWSAGRPSLCITDRAPFTGELFSWLKQFSAFAAAYGRVILAGQDRGLHSPILEATAQHMGAIALLAERGVVFERYQAAGTAAGIVSLIEERVNLQEFIDGLKVGEFAPAALCPAVTCPDGGPDQNVVSLSAGAEPEFTAEEGKVPARVFLALLARCYRAGLRITGDPDRRRPLLMLPAMPPRAANPQSDAPAENVALDYPAEPDTAVYRLSWIKQVPAPVAPLKPQAILVFAQRNVMMRLRAHPTFAHACWRCLDDETDEEEMPADRPAPDSADAFKRYFAERTIETVVFVWHSRQPLSHAGSSLRTALSLLQYVRSMPGKRPTLRFVTLGGQAVVDARIHSPAATMAWGLFRTAQLELDNVRCVLLDIDSPDETGVMSDQAVTALSMSLSTELDQSAWREGQLYLPTLVGKKNNTPSTSANAHGASGYHFITGGFGALGLALLQSLFADGERRFLLMGRTPPAGDALEVITGLRAGGAEILTRSGDVTCLEGMSAIVRESAETLGPLTAITHAAGVLAAGSLAAMSPEDFETGLAAKTTGALNLHIISEQWPVTRFVLVSSVSALFGFPRYAAYAAGNAYLDGLAGYRQGRGLPALSVGYGPFRDQGLLDKLDPALDFGVLAKMRMSEGIDALKSCAGEQGALAIMRYDGPAALNHPDPSPVDETWTYQVDEARTCPAGERHMRLCTLIKRVIARLLQQPAEAIPTETPLSELGVTSLLGVEARNRLQTALSLRMPATALWNYPTVSSLAGYLESLLRPSSSATPAAVSPCPPPPAATDDDDEDALMAQLLEELTTIKDVYKLGAR